MSKEIKKKYTLLAYVVFRDALGFYFGIPKFLTEENLKLIQDEALAKKLNVTKNQKGRDLTPYEITRCIRSVDKAIASRIQELEEDYQHCKGILFEKNLWTELLGLNVSFITHYIKQMNEQTKNELAVIPKWGINDHSLGRIYINDGFSDRISFYDQ